MNALGISMVDVNPNSLMIDHQLNLRLADYGTESNEPCKIDVKTLAKSIFYILHGEPPSSY
jgi:hypothetical protein